MSGSGNHDDDTGEEHELFRSSAPASGEGGFEQVPRSDRGVGGLPGMAANLTPEAESNAPSPFDVNIETQRIPVDAPQQLGRYVLRGLLGKGGMAEVYLAQQDGPAGFQKTCVVKRIRRSLAEEPKFVEMFLREARVAARLNHPNVVQIFELGQDGSDYFIAMEFLDGVSLHRAARRSWAKGESVPMEVCLRAIADAALGLHHAHTLSAPGGRATPLVHRDVSPDNIMLTRDGVSKVLDFGIAKSTDIDEQTNTGEVKGKIPFMSPEQLQGNNLDGRSDLWSLGVTLYWLLTGKRPFDGATEPMTIDAILRREPQRTRELNPLVPVSVDNIVMQLLEKDPARRIANAAELSDKLLSLLGPSAGYSGSAQFAAKVMEWKDVDGSPPPSVLTIVAARPESQWLKRVDNDAAAYDLIRLAPETTPPGPRQATAPLQPIELLPERVDTQKTVTGVQPEELLKEATPRLWPIAAGVIAAVALAIGGIVVVKGAKDERPEAPIVMQSATPPANVAATPADAAPPETPAPAAQEARPAPAVEGKDEQDEPEREARKNAASASASSASVKTAAPARVIWKLNGRVVGKGDATLKLPKGSSKLIAVDPQTGGQTHVAIVDGRADYNGIGNGTVVVRVRPWADVTLGSRKLGMTPIDPLTLKAGRYEFVFTRDGMTKRQSVEVKSGQTATLNVEMRD